MKIPRLGSIPLLQLLHLLLLLHCNLSATQPDSSPTAVNYMHLTDQPPKPGALDSFTGEDLPPLIIDGDSFLTFQTRPPLMRKCPAPPPLNAEAGISPVCQPYAQKVLLELIYLSMNGPNWVRKVGWPNISGDPLSWVLSQPLDALQLDPAKTCQKARPWGEKVEPATLNDYCCWEGITCCLDQKCPPGEATSEHLCGCTVGTMTALDLRSNNLAGAFPVSDLIDQAAGYLFDEGIEGDYIICNIQQLLLQDNKITGTIPSWLGLLKSLKVIGLGGNKLTGSIPPSVGSLPLLKELDVTQNSLNGSLPQGICRLASGDGTAALPNITDILIAGNDFSGPLAFDTVCPFLISLDAKDNRISGALPDLSGVPALRVLNFASNDLEGPIPNTIRSSRLLSKINLFDNHMTGKIPEIMVELIYLQSLNLGFNNINGTIPSSLFHLSFLTELVLSSMDLNGTIPEGIGNCVQLKRVMLRDNKLTGTIPSSMQLLSRASIDLSMNKLSCCGRNFNETRGSYETYDLSAPLLPETMDFSALSYQPAVHMFNGTNLLSGMSCPSIRLKDTVVLGHEVLMNMVIDPAYFRYQGCVCTAGHGLQQKETGDGFDTMFICVALPARKPATSSSQDEWWIYIIVALVALVATSIGVWFWTLKRGNRPEFVQAMLNIRKRMNGPPTYGNISVVVTDIEGYSNFMKAAPELMTSALLIHNAAMRKCKWSNYGFTVEQEGDSYSFLFYEAEDAAKFCIQAQLLLMHQEWPKGLFSSDEADPEPEELYVSSTRRGISKFFTIHSGVLEQHQQEQQHQEEPSVPSAFSGLKVRMGIATGVLPSGTPVQASDVMEQAKLVSDTAVGGQVLCDQATFVCIKNSLAKLGALSQSGYDRTKVVKRPWYRMFSRTKRDWASSALALYMGEYLQSCDRNLPQVLLASWLKQSNTKLRFASTDDFESSPTQCLSPTIANSFIDYRMKHDAKGLGQARDAMLLATQGHRSLHLYQILSPRLAGRAKHFLNTLALKEEWVEVQSPYFCAPGSLVASLGYHDPTQGLFPAMACVQCLADRGKVFSLTYRNSMKMVHTTAVSVILSILRASLDGGYLSQQCGRDLRYTLLFPTPEAALRWALVAQECFLYADWPPTAIKYWKEGVAEENPGRSVIFRGPAFKMAVCHGTPHSIYPDSAGRASYEGDFVERSASLADSCAHGGQVVCCKQLAEEVLNTWNTPSWRRPSLIVDPLSTPSGCSKVPSLRVLANDPALPTENHMSKSHPSQATYPNNPALVNRISSDSYPSQATYPNQDTHPSQDTQQRLHHQPPLSPDATSTGALPPPRESKPCLMQFLSPQSPTTQTQAKPSPSRVICAPCSTQSSSPQSRSPLMTPSQAKSLVTAHGTAKGHVVPHTVLPAPLHAHSTELANVPHAACPALHSEELLSIQRGDSCELGGPPQFCSNSGTEQPPTLHANSIELAGPPQFRSNGGAEQPPTLHANSIELAGPPQFRSNEGAEQSPTLHANSIELAGLPQFRSNVGAEQAPTLHANSVDLAGPQQSCSERGAEQARTDYVPHTLGSKNGSQRQGWGSGLWKKVRPLHSPPHPSPPQPLLSVRSNCRLPPPPHPIVHPDRTPPPQVAIGHDNPSAGLPPPTPLLQPIPDETLASSYDLFPSPRPVLQPLSHETLASARGPSPSTRRGSNSTASPLASGHSPLLRKSTGAGIEQPGSQPGWPGVAGLAGGARIRSGRLVTTPERTLLQQANTHSLSLKGEVTKAEKFNPLVSLPNILVGSASGRLLEASEGAGLHPYHTRVHALHIGTYKIKGQSEPVEMVQLLTDALLGRLYHLPSEPASRRRAKRTMCSSGTLKTGQVELSGIVWEYRDRVGAQKPI